MGIKSFFSYIQPNPPFAPNPIFFLHISFSSLVKSNPPLAPNPIFILQNLFYSYIKSNPPLSPNPFFSHNSLLSILSFPIYNQIHRSLQTPFFFFTICSIPI